MKENLYPNIPSSKKRCKSYASQWLGTTFRLAILLLGLILIQACGPKHLITAPLLEAMDHIKLAGEYGKRGNYAQAEMEATQAVYKCDLSLKRKFKNKHIVAEREYYRAIDECQARGHGLRGYALMMQGDLTCASFDLGWAVKHAKEANLNQFAEQSQHLLNQVNEEIKRTGPKGRLKCPPSVWLKRGGGV